MNRRTLNIKNRQNSQIPRGSKKYLNYQPIKNIITAKFTKTPKTNTGTLNITTNNTAKLSELKINEKNIKTNKSAKLSECPK